MGAIQLLWSRLAEVELYTFESVSRTDTGWRGSGFGQVVVSAPTSGTLIFEERGTFRQQGGHTTNTRNTYRWTQIGKIIRLEHLRFGAGQPVFLFDLEHEEIEKWRSSSPHMCKQDCYSARLEFGESEFILHWIVKGPTRDEEIKYVYR